MKPIHGMSHPHKNIIDTSVAQKSKKPSGEKMGRKKKGRKEEMGIYPKSESCGGLDFMLLTAV